MMDSVAEAVQHADILVDYTSHEAVRANVLAAIERGVAVVVGSSGGTVRVARRVHGLPKGLDRPAAPHGAAAEHRQLSLLPENPAVTRRELLMARRPTDPWVAPNTRWVRNTSPQGPDYSDVPWCTNPPSQAGEAP